MVGLLQREIHIIQLIIKIINIIIVYQEKFILLKASPNADNVTVAATENDNFIETEEIINIYSSQSQALINKEVKKRSVFWSAVAKKKNSNHLEYLDPRKEIN